MIKIGKKTEKLQEVRVRFAPSPTGNLHLGGARTALVNYLVKKFRGGQLILRIEDTDQTRLSADWRDYVALLEWFGICFDEKPVNDDSPYIQSQRLGLYQKHIESLVSQGKAYKCYMTSEMLSMIKAASTSDELKRVAFDIADKTDWDFTDRPRIDKVDIARCILSGVKHGRYYRAWESNRYIQLPPIKNTPYVIRFAAPISGYTSFDDIICGRISFKNDTGVRDAVLMKADGFPTYHFANVCDDHDMGITHVLRGSEWISSTPLHICLYSSFGWTPPEFGHLPLILSANGGKMSKRKGDGRTFLNEYKDYPSEAVAKWLMSSLVGIENAGKAIQDGVDFKSITNINGVLPNNLDHISRDIISKYGKEELVSQYKDRGMVEEAMKLKDSESLYKFISGRIKKISPEEHESVVNISRIKAEPDTSRVDYTKEIIRKLLIKSGGEELEQTMTMIKQMLAEVKLTSNAHKVPVDHLKRKVEAMPAHCKKIIRAMLAGCVDGANSDIIIDELGYKESIRRLELLFK